MLKLLMGIKSPPLFPDHPNFTEYDRLKRRYNQGLNDFTPSNGYEDLSAYGLMKMFLMNPLAGIIKK